MSRIVNFLAGLTVATAASATATCDSTGCSSCVGSGVAVICVNYTAPPAPPTCALPCSNACPTTASATGGSTTCNVCLGSTVGACVSATYDTGMILTAQSSLDAGLNLAAFGGATVVNVDASSSGSISSSNAIVNLGGTNAIANLNVGSGFASSAIFEVNSSVMVNAWTNNAGTAKVDNNCGALVVGNLSLGGSSFSVFQSCPTAAITISNIDFSSRGMFTGSSTLLVSGGMAHLGGGAPMAGMDMSGSMSGSGNLQLTGGVSVDGCVGSGVTIQVTAAGKSAPLAVVDASTTLNTTGNVQGDGTIVVNGAFTLGATTATVNPKVVINSAGSLVINSATALQAKSVQISTGATLVLGASANKAAVYIDQITQCLGTVQINLATTAAAAISAQGASGTVALTYNSNNVPANLKNCAVTVVDSTGASFSLTSTTSASMGRRLLASSGTATWGDSQMTYNMGQQASTAPVSFALLPVVVVGIFGLLL